MKLIYGIDSKELPLPGSILTIGNFDGVHRGHQQLLAQGGMLAASTGHPLTVLTFNPHPLSVVAPDRTPPPLMTADEKLTQLAAAGVDLTVVADSRSGILSMEAEAFITNIIINRFHPSHVIEGPTFGFGRARQGTIDLLKTYGDRCGFDVRIVGPINMPLAEGETKMVSSSMIRDLLQKGQTHAAHLCLGRPYCIQGPVIHGLQRGRDLGFPTVNICSENVLLPEDGVYSGMATLENETYPAAISIGTTPTFKESERKIEAYLLDFNKTVYGKTIRLHFLKRLRSQQKFSSASELTEAMKKDVSEVRLHARDYEVSTPG